MGEPDGELAALLRERDAYVKAGKPDRVAAVDEQLRLRGYEATGGKRGPVGRRRPPARGACAGSLRDCLGSQGG